jgi:hypothetical protein
VQLKDILEQHWDTQLHFPFMGPRVLPVVPFCSKVQAQYRLLTSGQNLNPEGLTPSHADNLRPEKI